MKITEEEYYQYCDDNAGYCTSCDDVTQFDGVEPDAENYPCPECGERNVMGIEMALLYGHIDID